MRLPTTVRYAARAMAQLAAAYPDHTVSVREVGEEQRVSPKYLEHILRAMKAAGFIHAVHGKQGGYALARSPGSITLKNLYDSLAGPLAPVHCVANPESCPMREVCPIWDTWVEVKEAVERVLDRTTLQDLLERKRLKAGSPAPMYYL
jgi:Rrf2 family cysteine metabolism transcriptional repressor